MTSPIGLVPRGGDQAIFMSVDDIIPIVESDGSAPATWGDPPEDGWVPSIVAYGNVPEIMKDSGAKQVYAIGHYDPQADVAGRKTYTINQELKITDPTFLAKAFRTGAQLDDSGYDDLPNFGLFLGFSDYLGRGGLEFYRKCAIDSLEITFSEGNSAEELKANLKILALAMDSSDISDVEDAYGSPTMSDLTAGRTLIPLTWHNFIHFVLNAEEYRDIVSEVKIRIENNIELKGCRPVVLSGADDGAHDLSRCAFTMLPRTRTVTVTLTLHNECPDGILEVFNAGSIVISVKPGLVEQNATGHWTLTIPNNSFKSTTQKGMEPGSQMSFSLDLLSSGITQAWAAPA